MPSGGRKAEELPFHCISLGEIVEAGVWETSPAVLAVADQERTIRPYLDDLAQIAGPTIRCTSNLKKGLKRRNAVLIPRLGAFCTGADGEAVGMILNKGAMAQLYAQAAGGCRPLSLLDGNLMRQFYLRSYSKKKLNSMK